jgi:hypothetical protein
VASRSPRALEWANSHQLGEDIAGEVAKLKEHDGGEIQVPGSSELMQALLKSDLVDEFHLMVFPVIAGSGKRLFDNGSVPRGLSLKSVEATATGVVIQVYERTGDLKTGEFGPSSKKPTDRIAEAGHGGVELGVLQRQGLDPRLADRANLTQELRRVVRQSRDARSQQRSEQA